MKLDTEYEDCVIAEVRPEDGGGWTIKRANGWSFSVPPESPVTPAVGMTARFYGRGIGYSVRGLTLDGVCVFYRTAAEEQEYREIQSYGADATEWLKRWDANDGVWSISMGGFGPGYEQCIQITTAEILRVLLDKKYDVAAWGDKDVWQRQRDEIEKIIFALPAIERLGLSGAQWGAAMNLACMLYRKGPRAVMTDERVKDRHIQVRRRFPQAESTAAEPT